MGPFSGANSTESLSRIAKVRAIRGTRTSVLRDLQRVADQYSEELDNEQSTHFDEIINNGSNDIFNKNSC